MDKIEFSNKECMVVSPNSVSENLVSRIGKKNSIAMKLDQIVGIRYQEDQRYSQVKHQSGNNRKGWYVHVDGTTTWNELKDVRDSYPTQLAEFVLENNFANFLIFKYWVYHTINK